MTPSEPEQWIVVCNWDRFQSYPNRNPPWIKNYTRLMHDPNYLRLTGNRRALLHALWMEYAMSDRCLPLDLYLIRTWTGLNVKMRDLESLNHAGFIEFSVDKPLQPRAWSRDLDLEVEQEQKPASQSEVQYEAVENFDSLETLEAIFGRQAGFPQAEESEEPWS